MSQKDFERIRHKDLYGKVKDHIKGRRFSDTTKEMIEKIIIYRLCGYPFSKIAKYFGVARSRVSNIENEFLRSLSKAERSIYHQYVDAAKESILDPKNADS